VPHGGIARGVDSWRYRASLEQAKARIASGSPAEAWRLLAESAARWPKEGELIFLLGACEQALGRPDAAEAAWSRVPADSPVAGHAAMLRFRLLLERDRFAAAEALLPAALGASGSGDAGDARFWGRHTQLRYWPLGLAGVVGSAPVFRLGQAVTDSLDLGTIRTEANEGATRSENQVAHAVRIGQPESCGQTIRGSTRRSVPNGHPDGK